MLKTAYVLVRIKKNKEKGNEFPTYSIMKENGEWAKLKPTKECTNLPKERGGYDITFESTLASRGHDDYGEIWYIKGNIESVAQHEYEDFAANEF